MLMYSRETLPNPPYFLWAKCHILLCTLHLLLMVSYAEQNKLTLWIDEEQVSNFIGMRMDIYIIRDGEVSPYLSHPSFKQRIPVIPPQVDTVNLTWEAGEDEFTYWFNVLRSLNDELLYNPLLSVPSSGVIPSKTTVFQMTIPCTGNKGGVASLELGLQIFDSERTPIEGSPIKFKLRKECREFVTTSLCLRDCKNGGRCNQFGECECTQGFNGRYCESAMCYPSCVNNGTCISPNYCLCEDGFSGKQCEITMCPKPCLNGGRCIESNLCWCTSGFYGGSCQFSKCFNPCKHGGVCIDQDKCRCPPGFTGNQCEKTACRKPCHHGVCVDKGTCQCELGWRGRYCHKPSKRNLPKLRNPRSQHGRRKTKRRKGNRSRPKRKRGRKNKRRGRKNQTHLKNGLSRKDNKREPRRKKIRKRKKAMKSRIIV